MAAAATSARAARRRTGRARPPRAERRARCRRTRRTGSAGCSPCVRASIRRARTMPRRSPFTSVIAGALHRDVRARAHRDADVGRASAGASLMPSPAIATCRPPPEAARRRAPSPRAGRSASTSLDAEPPATRVAVVRLSPVSITMRSPSPRSARSASARRRLHRIGDRRGRPAGAVDRHEHHRLAAAHAPRRLARRAASGRRLAREAAGCPRRRAPAHHPARHALAGPRRERHGIRSLASPRASDDAHDRRTERVLALALEALRRGAARPRLGALEPAPRRSDERVARPAVSVPVLSRTSGSTFSRRIEHVGVLHENACGRTAAVSQP